MRKINPFDLDFGDYSIRITNIRQSPELNALGKFSYQFKMIVKNPKKNINDTTGPHILDSNNLKEFKIDLKLLIIQSKVIK